MFLPRLIFIANSNCNCTGLKKITVASLSAQQNGKYLMLAGLGCEAVSFYFMFDRKKHARILVDACSKKISGIR